MPPGFAKRLLPAMNRGTNPPPHPYHFLRITDEDYTGLGEAAAADT